MKRMEQIYYFGRILFTGPVFFHLLKENLNKFKGKPVAKIQRWMILPGDNCTASASAGDKKTVFAGII